jgi:hypothetical protein
MLKKVLTLLVLACAASAAHAKVYYVNQSVKYHLGDGRYGNSEDAEFLDAYPVVGPKWVQAFTVDKPDIIKVRVDHLWGVDDCPYCKDMIYIDDRPMARMFHEDNGRPFNTPQPLSFRVVPGHIYLLRIESFGAVGAMDDFAFEGVSVVTDEAEVKMMEPGPVILKAGQPLPVFKQPEGNGPCGTELVKDWLPPSARSQGVLSWEAGPPPQARLMAQGVASGQSVRLFVKMDPAGGDSSVEQFMEVTLGDPSTGWVFSAGPGSTAPTKGNVKVKGTYRGKSFDLKAWKSGEWNQVEAARCFDGFARLWINGKDAGAGLPLAQGSDGALMLRSGGLKILVAPQKF